MLVGMGLYSTDTPGTGGSIKEKREDFAVNEVLAEKTLSRIAENTGYAVYKLDKNGIDTNHALAEVQKRTGVRLRHWDSRIRALLPHSTYAPHQRWQKFQNMMVEGFP